MVKLKQQEESGQRGGWYEINRKQKIIVTVILCSLVSTFICGQSQYCKLSQHFL